MKEFKGLSIGEIRRVERFAQKRDGKDSRVTGCSYNGTPDEWGWIKVRCEICSNDYSHRENDVVIYIFMLDRRRSFISKALSNA